MVLEFNPLRLPHVGLPWPAARPGSDSSWQEQLSELALSQVSLESQVLFGSCIQIGVDTPVSRR